MFRIIISFCFIVVTNTTCSAQKAANYFDSLSRLTIAPSDSVIISELEKVADLARIESDDTTLVTSLIYLSSYYFDEKSLLKYEKVVTESSEIAKNNNKVKPWMIGSILNNQALLESTKGNYQLASEYYLMAVESEKNGANDSTELSMVYSNIASNYTQLGDFTKSLDFIEQAIRYCSANNADNDRIRLRLLSIAGKTAFQIKNFNLARKYYNQAESVFNKLSIKKKAISNYLLMNNLQRIVELDLEERHYEKARKRLDKLYTIKTKNSNRVFRTHYLEGVYHDILGNISEAHKNFDTAIQLIEEGANKSKEFGFLQNIYALKAQSYYNEGNLLSSCILAHNGLATLDSSIRKELFMNPEIGQFENYPVTTKLLLTKARSAISIAKKGDPSYYNVANQSYMALCSLLNKMKKEYLSEGSKFYVAETAQPIYEEAIEELYSQYNLNKSDNLLNNITE